MVTRRRLAPLMLVWSMLALGAGSAACAGIFGFERLSEQGFEGGAPEGSTEAGEDAPPFEGGPQCTELGVPNRPTLVDAGGADAPAPIHMAVKLLDFGIDNKAAPVGFNLDHACSPTVASSTCKTTIDEETWAKYGKDKDDKGVDNSGFGLLGYLAFLGNAFSPTEINNRLNAGEFGVVMRITGWNETNEDEDVTVEIFPAVGVSSVNDAGVTGTKPTGQPSDQWQRDKRFQNVVDASKIVSAQAWVTGGRLVASFQTVTLPISVPDDKKPLDVIVHEGYLSGAIVPDGAGFKLVQAVLGGRWRTSEMLQQVRTIWVKDTAGLKNVVLCDPNLPVDVYTAVKKQVCDGRDIRTSSQDDGKGLPCDAFSVGMKIDTYAVDLPGPFVNQPPAGPPAPLVADRCKKDGSIPATDDCAPAFP